MKIVRFLLAILGLAFAPGIAFAQCTPSSTGINSPANCVPALNLQPGDLHYVWQTGPGSMRKATNQQILNLLGTVTIPGFTTSGSTVVGGGQTISGDLYVGGAATFVGTVTIPNIVLGSLNNTPIGGTTRASGAFTTLGANGAATLSGGGTLSGGWSINGAALAGGTIENIAIGGSTRAPGAFTTLATDGAATVGGTLSLQAGASVSTASIATGTAATDTSVLQAAATAVPSNGGILVIPSGVYAINAPILLHSNTHVLCAKGATLRPTVAGSWTNGKWLFANVNNGGTLANGLSVITDHDIAITGCKFDMSLVATDGGFHAVNIQWATRIDIGNIHCTGGGGDCTAIVASFDTVVHDSYAEGIINSCWDHWYHPEAGVVRNNVCRGIVGNASSCIFYNSVNTLATDNSVSLAGVIDGNECQGPMAIGIWIGSLPTAASGSGDRFTKVINNHIDVGGGHGECIKNEGASQGVIIAHNTCTNAVASDGAIIDLNDTGGTPSATLIEGNHISNWALSASNAIIWSAGNDPMIRNNFVAPGASFPFALRLTQARGTSFDNQFASGSSGTYSLTGGSSYVIRDFRQATPGTLSACGTSPSFSSLSNDRNWTVNVGAGGGITSCHFAWRNPIAVTPVCTVTADVAGANPSISSLSTASITVATAADVSGGHLYGHCTGAGE